MDSIPARARRDRVETGKCPHGEGHTPACGALLARGGQGGRGTGDAHKPKAWRLPSQWPLSRPDKNAQPGPFLTRLPADVNNQARCPSPGKMGRKSPIIIVLNLAINITKLYKESNYKPFKFLKIVFKAYHPLLDVTPFCIQPIIFLEAERK